MIEQFKKDVKKGLEANPKFLSSKYFYDKKGDELFVEIMNLEEYYLTRSEFEIFSKKTQDIIDSLKINKNDYFELIELGAGDGTKTKELLKELLKQNYNFDYIPIDISQNALDKLEASLKEEMPKLSVKTKQGDYFKILSSFKDANCKKVVLCLGSNIGNLRDDLSAKFIYQLGANLKRNDVLFLGVDLIKEESVVIPAYSDSKGVTAKFNLNLLTRINRELGADFDLNLFKHKAEYTREEGIAKSYLVSLAEQEVYIESIETKIHFEKGERIHTEISREYSDNIIRAIIKDADFEIDSKIMDSKNYFADYVLVRG